MKMYYFDIKNFGDQLNPWLWPKVFNDFSWLGDRLFVGIGTILNTNLPVGVDKVVLGAGAGYKPLPDLTKDKWDIRAVRGPLTARKLNIPMSLAVTDGAILVSDYTPPDAVKKEHKLSVIFHHHSYSYCDWTGYLEDNGIHVINPQWPVDEVIESIRKSHCVAAEAMHGAILADTLRVPWFSFKMYPQILDFKWNDWAASMDLEYRPVEARAYFGNDINYPFGKSRYVVDRMYGSKVVKSMLNSISLPLIGNQLLRSLRNGTPQLSKNTVFASRLDRMRNIAGSLMVGCQ